MAKVQASEDNYTDNGRKPFFSVVSPEIHILWFGSYQGMRMERNLLSKLVIETLVEVEKSTSITR
jgi:hypothetical protein